MTSLDELFNSLDAQTAARVIAAAADITLVIDGDGVIRNLSYGGAGKTPPGYLAWLDKPWVDTVGIESRTKVERLLHDAKEGGKIRSREINQRAQGSPDLPLRYSAIRLGDEGRILAVGHDLRALANLQQQLVNTQQLMEREYSRLRQAETRYRLLFHISSEGVVVVDAANNKIVEANPAACSLTQETAQTLNGRDVFALFEDSSVREVRRISAESRASGRTANAVAKLKSDADVAVSTSVFRQDNGTLLLYRLAVIGEDGVAMGRDTRLLDVISAMPDAFVVCSMDCRVASANTAFLEMVQQTNESQVVDQPLERWLGRPGADLKLLVANLKEHGSVRNFATTLSGAYGSDQDVEVSAVRTDHNTEDWYGFVIRLVSPRTTQEVLTDGSERSVEHLTSLVGRVSLKEIVRETTELIERLCIEAALEASQDNRASAAQILGVSRQSLYSKLRLHGLGDYKSKTDEGS